MADAGAQSEAIAFTAGNIRLSGQISRPAGQAAGDGPAVLLCHGFPSTRGVVQVANSYGILADRIAAELGWTALAFNFRGCGGSEGDFSLDGWIEDIHAAIDLLADQEEVRGVWVAGSSIGGALGLCAAAHDDRVRGVATLGAPVSFSEWASSPRRLLALCTDLGVITTPGFPENFEMWSRQLRDHRPLDAARDLAPRPMLVIHGLEDDVVSSFDARALADAHGDSEMRLLAGGEHRLRHDPRAVAILLGWLARQVTAPVS